MKDNRKAWRRANMDGQRAINESSILARLLRSIVARDFFLRMPRRVEPKHHGLAISLGCTAGFVEREIGRHESIPCGCVQGFKLASVSTQDPNSTSN
jgi:hypothetical protein